MLPGKGAAVPTKVAFQPASGPWKTVPTREGYATLARGWIAQDEPGVFLLNEQLQQQLALPNAAGNRSKRADGGNCECRSCDQSAAVALSQSNEVVHLLRGDGAVTDHMRLDEPVRGLALVPVGNQLILYVAHEGKMVTYRIGR